MAQPLVLIITNDAVAWELESRFLHKKNYRVIEAKDTTSILKILQTEEPDCIYLDISTSAANVFSTCDEIRKAENNSHIPMMIGISGIDDTVIDLCFDMGADDYITRPAHLTPRFLKILAKRIELLIKRKQTEKEMARQQKLLETIVNSIPDIICLKDGEGRWLLANDFDLNFFQLQDVDYKGKTDADLAQHSSFYRDAFLTCMDTDQQAWKKGTPDRGEELILRPDNTLRVFDLVKIPLFNADGSRQALVVTGRDITERIEAEKEREISARKLRRAQKMEAIGLMAGGVAHDLNNILSGLVSYPELLLLQLPEDSEVRPYIEAMQKSGQQATEVVADLLTVARGAAGVRIAANLNVLVKDYLNSIEFREIKRLHEKIEYSVNLASDLTSISCSPIHIKKCLMNLIINSTEAISGHETIRITTRNQHLDSPLEGHPAMKRGAYVVLSISDTGDGISENDLEHIFEPFYSKKIMHRSGTGLGLTVVWNTVQDHNGGITVESNDQGTTFELYFPTTHEQIATEYDQIRIDDLKGKGEKILIVDDENLQLEITGKLLTTLGYTAIPIKSGEEAIRYLKNKSVDLILLDMIMDPGLNGRKTYERIIQLHPGQKALIVSGFAENEEVKKAQALGAGAFIKKPYTLTQLGFAVKEILLAC